MSPSGSDARPPEAPSASAGGASRYAWVKARVVPPLLLLASAVLLGSGVLPFPCPVRALTGFPCPGCGMTRATHLVLHGDLHGALAIHPLVLVLFPWALVLLVAELVGHARRGRFVTWVEHRPLRLGTYAIVGAATVVWIARFFGAFGGPVPA